MQVYVIVWQKIGQHVAVLVAEKKVAGARFGGKITEPSILNYAGQWVFPGGKVEGGDTPEQAAYREFFEETGHRLRWDVVAAGYSPVDQYHGILYVQSSNIQLMAAVINENLKGGKTLDDELARVAVFIVPNALALFGKWVEQSAEVEGVLKKRSKDYRDRSWFTNALKKAG
jgi:8-oxo-dGTP pyrophosphatase MutT (NUDIX family)